LERLDEDLTRGLVAQSDAATVDLTKHGGAAGDFDDEGALAETHLAHPLAESGVPNQVPDATDSASRKLAQGEFSGTVTLVGRIGHRSAV